MSDTINPEAAMTDTDRFQALQKANAQGAQSLHVPDLNPAPFDAQQPTQQAVEDAARVNAMSDFQREQAVSIQGAEYDALTPTEKKIHCEHKYLPLIQQAASTHRAACDAVADYEDSEQAYKIQLAATYAGTAAHPEIRRVVCNGDEHHKFLLKSGAYEKDGYHPIEKRGSIVLCVPSHVMSLVHYATSPEAVASAQSNYDGGLKRLVEARDRASVAMVQIQLEAQQVYEAIPDITSFFTKIKQAKAKKD